MRLVGPRPGDRVARRACVGRRFEWVSGSQRRQVCQTPFGATWATNTNRPLANWGVLSERSARSTSSRPKSRLT